MKTWSDLPTLRTWRRWRSNDFNLNISRYVDTTEPVEVMSVEDALTQLRQAEKRRDEAVAKMDELLAEMGYVRS